MLAPLEGFAAATVGRLDANDLGAVANELASLDDAVRANTELSAVLSDTSISPRARGAILSDLLSEKVRDDTRRLSCYAASVTPAPEVPHVFEDLARLVRRQREEGSLDFASLGLLQARRRVAGFADALLEGLDTAEFSSIEDDLFRWARTVEGNDDLRRLLTDRDAPLARRSAVTTALLEGKVHAGSLELAYFTLTGGRARDVVGTLDYLVNYVAAARHWRVARVHSARDLDESDTRELVAALSRLAGQDVELHVASAPLLLGGLLVEIGDLRLDATTKGRLEALRDVVTSRTLELAND